MAVLLEIIRPRKAHSYGAFRTFDAVFLWKNKIDGSDLLRLYDDEAREIIGAILTQAVTDYRLLLKNGQDVIKDQRAGYFGKEEIREFFSDEWGEDLVHIGLNCDDISGLELLRNAAGGL